MAQFGPITVKNRAGNNEVYAPRNISGGVALAINAAGGVPIADRRLTLAVTETPSGKRKVAIKFVVPTVQDTVIGGVSKPALVRTMYADLVFTVDGTSTLLERQDMATRLSWLFQDPIIIDAIENLSNPY